MHDIIELLLQKKGELNESKETAIAEALVRIDAEFAEREKQINALLDLAGYVERVADDPVAVVDDNPVVDEATESVAPVAEEATESVSNVVNVVNGSIAY